MEKILISWIGKTDLRAVEESAIIGLGPIAQAVETTPFSQITLISDFPEHDSELFINWLQHIKKIPILLKSVKLSSPTHFGEICEAVTGVIKDIRTQLGKDADLTFHLSPGTPAMAAVWILLAKTLYPATLIESSKEQGVKVVDIPFDISAEFLPLPKPEDDRRLWQLMSALPPEAPEFESIICRSPEMKRVVAKARLVSHRSVPVLIEGESGTGKELLARAIHRAGPRRDKPFIAVNCGAIPAELIESEFFGHRKGAFTGAAGDRKGYFEAADNGTLFLDEIGELPPAAQVKILRVLQEGELVRLGDTTPVKVDALIIAATNRSLLQEISAGRFRADLFYRLAVAVLRIPPLRERQGDIGLLIDYFLQQIEDFVHVGKHKIISTGARNLLLSHPWPGNVRELLNTLRRAAVWSTEDTIQTDDIREALFPVELNASEHILNRSISDGFSIQDTIAEVARHYLLRAMEQCSNNKTNAAKTMGLQNYQTLTNWLKKYGLE
jgi:DNA-binding NtrC family response regulator